MKQQSTVSCTVFVMGIVRRAIVPASLMLGACSADPVDLGDGRLGVDRSALVSYAAAWEGYVEAYQFDSGSDRVRLVLDENGDGTFSFGDGQPWPQPTDPDTAFPFERFADPSGYSFENIPTPIEGFAYHVGGALVEDERLRAATPASQVFDAACAIQTPVLVDQSVPNGDEPGPVPPVAAIGSPEYSCLSELGYSEGPPGSCFTGLSGQAVSCTKARLCSNHCECTATLCSARAESELRLDAALNDAGDRLEGTLVGLNGDARATVRLTRAATH